MWKGIIPHRMFIISTSHCRIEKDFYFYFFLSMWNENDIKQFMEKKNMFPFEFERTFTHSHTKKKVRLDISFYMSTNINILPNLSLYKACANWYGTSKISFRWESYSCSLLNHINIMSGKLFCRKLIWSGQILRLVRSCRVFDW